MGVIDYDRINSDTNTKQECIAYCIQFAKEMPDALKEAHTPIETRNAKYAHGCPVVEKTAKRRGGLLSPKIAEFYCIFTDSRVIWSDVMGAIQFGACISTSGRYFFKFEELTAMNFGFLIAEACGFNKELAESVLYDAIAGNFWSLDDIWAAQDKNGGTNIQVQGEGNVVAGRDAYGR